MRNKLAKITLAATLGFALTFNFSCSDGGGNGSGNGNQIKKDKISGISQKGPFVEGSTVTLYELNERFAQTGRSFKSIIADNKGSFEIKGVELISPYAILEANGYYRNEVTGEVSKSLISLFAIADIREKDNFNVNLLTHLEYYRVLNLVEGGKSVAEAKKQAQKEILSVFGINGNFENSEDMSIFGATEGDAALLAISILLQGDLGEGEFSQRLTNFAQSLKESGKWEDETAKMAMAGWVAAGISGDPNGRYCIYASTPEYPNNCWPMPTEDNCRYGTLVNSCPEPRPWPSASISSIRNNILAWGLSSDVPDFGKYVIAYWTTAYGLGGCGSANGGEVKKDNRNVYRICETGNWAVASALDYDTYQWSCSTINEGEIKKGSVSETEYICKSEAWRVAREFESDTYQWSCSATNEGEIKKGDASGENYVCENKAWRYATYEETDIQSVCLASNEGEIKAGKVTGTDYICKSKTWEVATEFESDTYQWSCSAANEGEIKAGKATGIDYICKSKAWGVATEFERDTYQLSCSATNIGEIKKGMVSDKEYVCKYGVWREPSYKEKYCFENKCSYLTDTRDNQRYAYVVIGEQTWMAENLNYNASGSKCYENKDANCDKYGRLYDWATAMGFASSCNDDDCSSQIKAKHRGICPSGWHLPTREEWEVIIAYIGGEKTGGKKLKATIGWDYDGGTDEYGLSALPGGYGSSDSGFGNVGNFGYWWSATTDKPSYADYRYMGYNYDYVGWNYASHESKLLSLRCVQD